ncbi:MAG: nucleoside 2-deoxyribosyltransferase [Candidatus Brocadiia bacterium]
MIGTVRAPRRKAKKRIYCAGPLFNAKEKEEMAELASAFEAAGYRTFLPQRDGLELTICIERLMERGVPAAVASDAMLKAIFALDVYQVIKVCDGVVVNLNGRVPDEGAVSEAALAWCAGKTLVGYKSDSRSVFLGHDNPLVVGLFGFEIRKTVGDAVEAMKRSFAVTGVSGQRREFRKAEIRTHLAFGAEIWKAMKAERGVDSVAELLRAKLDLPRIAEKDCVASR